ncbi:MAG: peroxiredoxin [Eubacteriales bacterium]|nr:peroxiredoxin [Eubacteriales bacterium]
MENINNTQPVNTLPLIGDKAPAFKANTTQGPINFPEDFKGKWVILFSHPADFTPVCTTEFMTFASMQEEFDALNVQLIGLSVDSIHSHIAWLRRIQELEWKNIKKPEVKFPLIDDVSMEVSHKYGMIHPSTGSTTSAVRAVFIIDDKGVVRTILYYPASTGRNFDEIKRIVVALQKADKETIATPADWRPGDDVIMPAPGTCGAAKDAIQNQSDDKYCLDWFLCFRKEK